MKIILSPAKNMREADDILAEATRPRFLKKQAEVFNQLASFSYEELKDVFKVSDKVCRPIYDQYQKVKSGFQPALYPAVFAYHGIAYQYMAPDVMSDEELAWLQDHLLIISGMYGLLRPLDEIMIYRIEMHTKIPWSLYDFWGSIPADSIPENEPILNLASAEYSKVIKRFRDTIDVRFLTEAKGKRSEKAVYAKMARGRMVRWCAEHQISDPYDVKAFDDLGFIYDPEASSEKTLVFVRQGE